MKPQLFDTAEAAIRNVPRGWEDEYEARPYGDKFICISKHNSSIKVEPAVVCEWFPISELDPPLAKQVISE